MSPLNDRVSSTIEYTNSKASSSKKQGLIQLPEVMRYKKLPIQKDISSSTFNMAI